jgi:hypothetical protein
MCKKLISGLFGGGAQEQPEAPARAVVDESKAIAEQTVIKETSTAATASGLSAKKRTKRERLPGLGL